MKTHPRRLVRGLLVSLAVIAALVLTLAAVSQRTTPELALWHTAHLESELTVRNATTVASWDDYLELEASLFRELEERIVRPSTGANRLWNRYAAGGVNNPDGFPLNWNRSFELTVPEPAGGALLIHGLTDSPYSLRRVGEIFRDHGLQVVGLRLPGHGTAPSALRDAGVADWRIAVRIAYRHLRSVVAPGAPIIVAGYSNGGALALDLALDSLDDPELATPDQIVLFSPAIGITRAAALARAHHVLSWMPWFSKLGWSGVEPELDPFKYSSFPTDAGYQTHRLTTSVRQRLGELQGAEDAAAFPPVLTFMSLADATVLVEAVVEGLHDRLTDRDSELVVFDINRQARMRDFFRVDPAARLSSLMARASTPYRLTVITNADDDSAEVREWSRPAGATEGTWRPLDLAWPRGFYSLSHLAIPFPPDDPVYGFIPAPEPAFGLQLGNLEPRGERGLLSIAPDQFTRLRCNPFFSYIEQRLAALVGDRDLWVQSAE